MHFNHRRRRRAKIVRVWDEGGGMRTVGRGRWEEDGGRWEKGVQVGGTREGCFELTGTHLARSDGAHPRRVPCARSPPATAAHCPPRLSPPVCRALHLVRDGFRERKKNAQEFFLSIPPASLFFTFFFLFFIRIYIFFFFAFPLRNTTDSFVPAASGFPCPPPPLHQTITLPQHRARHRCRIVSRHGDFFFFFAHRTFVVGGGD